MKNWFRSLALLLALSLLFIPAIGLADMGDFSGDSDFGGSDWGSSDWGSSDWGSSDWGSSDWGSSDSSDWSWSFGSGSSDYSTDDDDRVEGFSTYDDGSYTSGGGGISIFAVIVVVVIVIIILSRLKKGSKSVAPGAVATNQATLRPISELMEQDPNFSETAFCEKLGNYYVQMQNCWTAKDITSLRSIFTDALYAQFDRQLDSLKQLKRTNRVDRISVLGTRIMGWMQDDVNDKIVARIQTRIVDYVVDDTTGAIVRGSNSKELFMDYEWTLVRTKGKKTEQATGTTQVHCNSCGALVDINHSAKCEYCGSVLTSSDYDWVISAIKGISQRSS